jgi:hypothetical protein
LSNLRPYLITLLLATLSGATSAFQPLITDDTGTQGQGGKQIEVTFVDEQASVAGDTTRTRTLPLVYTWGATDTLDVYVGIVPTQIRSSIPGADTGGMGNTAIGLKWRFLESEDSGTSLAIKPEIRLPVDSAQEATGLGTGMTSYGLMLILSQDVPFGAIHFNLSRGRDQFLDANTRPHANSLRTSIAPVWNINDQWTLALETGRESVSTAGDTTTTQFVQLGAIYSPDKDLDIALGLLRNADGATPQTTTTTATLGLTWRFR